MASELSESICETYFHNTEGALLRNVIDAELQEVREVLNGLRVGSGNCWCDAKFPNIPACHADACQRARALMSKLEVGP